MRRISLALALVGAMAAGCGDDNDDGNNLPPAGSFTLTVENGQTNPALAIVGGKVVSTSPASAIDCGVGGDAAKCAVEFPAGTTVVLAAQPAAPKVFSGWSGACSGTGACTVTLDADKTVAAAFGDPPAAVHQFATGTFANAYEVTAECVKCHAAQATQVMGTLHWTWAGPTPELHRLVDFVADPTTALNPGNIGKKNLINNFCVAVASNEKRCDQCHAGYGGDPDATKPQKSARAYTTADSSIPLEHRVDCLICHADLTATGYAKAPATFGVPAATVDLAAAASSVKGEPARENCGACHFYAGGGDNVKLMGSALKNPSVDLDVHMGNGTTCAACHSEPGHQFKGAGIHVPANNGRASCEDCHGATPHAGKFAQGATFDAHTNAIACQTCHIPTFSRGQFAKMDWDWATAGDKSKGTNGVVKTAVNDAGVPTAGGTEVTTYDYIKGDFVWKRNVKPAYAWYNGKMVHVTAMDKGAFTAETGLSGDHHDRITLGAPLGSGDDPTAKIFPFKLMHGRQAVYVDGDNSFVIVPNVFGPAGFWGVVQSAGYTYDAGTGMYTAPNAATPVTTPTPLDDLLSAAFTKGAKAAGQLAADAPAMVKSDGTSAGWAWRYTKLYMDLNHEVAPKDQALGAGANCTTACHSATPVIDWTALGYTCANPWGCPKR